MLRPAATRIQLSETLYSSTSVRSLPLKRIPTPRRSSSPSKKGLRGLSESRSGGVSAMFSSLTSGVEPLSRPYGRGGARRQAAGGEGLADSLLQTLTSQASLGPLLSREKRERSFSPYRALT